MNDTSTSFFMVSSDRSVSPAQASTTVYPLILTAVLEQASAEIGVSRLIRAAEISYGKRDYPTLEQIAQILTATSSGQDAGLYYLALLESIKGNSEQARAILEPLVRYGCPATRARALQCLALTHYRQRDISEARTGYIEAMRAAKDIDLLSQCFALQGLSILRSDAGDHYGALLETEQTWPLTRALAPSHPFLFYAFHNNLAFDLARIGKLDEASKHSAIACNWALIDSFPEWKETQREIEAIRQARADARALVVIHKREPERKNKAALAKRSRSHFLAECALRSHKRLSRITTPKDRALGHSPVLEQVKRAINPRSPPDIPLF